MKKKLLLFIIISLFTGYLSAQQIIDTVSMGAAYVNNKWYSLANDEQGIQAANNWDLGFATGTFESALIFNETVGNVYVIPESTPGTFSTADTVGLSNWSPLYNSDTTWDYGALNRPATGAMDYGYGTYNPITHNIDGNRVFVIKYTNGSCKKFYIQQNYLGGSLGYNIIVTSADINNSNEQTLTFNKSTYQSKNFVYFSVLSNTTIDREPASENWDLLFTKYVAANYGTATNQLVTGVLQNRNIQVAEARGIEDVETYTNYSAHPFQNNISTIGADWKQLDYSTPGFPFIIKDSLIYFVKTRNNDIYKLVFTGFIGSSAGSFIFNKEKLTSTGLISNSKNSIALTLYPNPNKDGLLNVIYSSEVAEEFTNLIIHDVYGKMIFQKQLSPTTGLQQLSISTSTFTSGIYVITLRSKTHELQQKLIVQ